MTKPSLDLFPEPAPLSTSPTWEDVERLALHYPSAQNVVALVERGDMTREQGLVSLVWWFATAFSRQFRREVEESAREVLDTLVQETCGCSQATYIRRRVVPMQCALHQSPDPPATGRP